VIPYGISLVTLGYPLFVLETALGQGTGKSPIGALSVSVHLTCLGFFCETLLSLHLYTLRCPCFLVMLLLFGYACVLII
jgi:SNF family Na+-dependent transporter